MKRTRHHGNDPYELLTTNDGNKYRLYGNPYRWEREQPDGTTVRLSNLRAEAVLHAVLDTLEPEPDPVTVELDGVTYIATPDGWTTNGVWPTVVGRFAEALTRIATAEAQIVDLEHQLEAVQIGRNPTPETIGLHPAGIRWHCAPQCRNNEGHQHLDLCGRPQRVWLEDIPPPATAKTTTKAAEQ